MLCGGSRSVGLERRAQDGLTLAVGQKSCVERHNYDRNSGVHACFGSPQRQPAQKSEIQDVYEMCAKFKSSSGRTCTSVVVTSNQIVLSKVCGYVEPGHLFAIMEPSRLENSTRPTRQPFRLAI